MCRNTGIKVYISHIKVEKQETHGSHRSPEQRFLVSFYISFFTNILPIHFYAKIKTPLGTPVFVQGLQI